MKTASRIGALAVLSAILLAACSNDKTGAAPEQGNASMPAISGPPETSAPSAPVQPVSTHPYDQYDFTAKYNAYVAGPYEVRNKIYEAMNDYIKYSDGEVSPNGYGRSRFGMRHITASDIDRADGVVEMTPAQGGEAFEDVDALMTVANARARDFAELADDMKLYYDREEFHDDQHARAEAQHPKYIAAFEAYDAAFEEADAAFVELKEKIFLHEAEKVRDSGNITQYQMILAMNAANRITDMTGAFTSASRVDFDVETLRGDLKAFTEAADAVIEASKDTKRVGADLGSMGPGIVERWSDDASDFIAHTKAFLRRYDENDFSYPMTHPTMPADGSPLQLNNDYSDLVRSYNRLGN